eukprot:TRINITY_DN15184_c0_g1_i2.p1 TRINITY_DN15184_c0_g1~~TRINITY_DN15184_c0_g1_i2.p1  ORF type:complete len:372 (+),score=77.24 TRINITY_DN15184_c0_g1_i2:94-1209(+)
MLRSLVGSEMCIRDRNQPLREALSLNPDVVNSCEKTMVSGHPQAIVNAPFLIGKNGNCLDYTVVPHEGQGYGPGHVWLVVSRVTPNRPDMALVQGRPAMEYLAPSLNGEAQTDIVTGTAVVVHFFIRREQDLYVGLNGMSWDELQQNLQVAVDDYLPACMDMLAQCPLLGILERFQKSTMSFTFGLPNPTKADIAQGIEFAFRLRDGLAGINKQRSIMNLPPIATCAMVKSGDMECGPQKWSSGPRAYDWLDKSIEDLLPVTMHYRVQGILVTDETLPNAGVGLISREIDNVFLPFSGLHCTVHEVISTTVESAPAILLRNLQMYSDGLAAYRARRWITATECFKQLVTLCHDFPSQTMIQHCQHLSLIHI